MGMLYKKIISHIITKYQLTSQLSQLVKVSYQSVLVDVEVSNNPLHAGILLHTYASSGLVAVFLGGRHVKLFN